MSLIFDPTHHLPADPWTLCAVLITQHVNTDDDAVLEAEPDSARSVTDCTDACVEVGANHFVSLDERTTPPRARVHEYSAPDATGPWVTTLGELLREIKARVPDWDARTFITDAPETGTAPVDPVLQAPVRCHCVHCTEGFPKLCMSALLLRDVSGR